MRSPARDVRTHRKGMPVMEVWLLSLNVVTGAGRTPRQAASRVDPRRHIDLDRRRRTSETRGAVPVSACSICCARLRAVIVPLYVEDPERAVDTIDGQCPEPVLNVSQCALGSLDVIELDRVWPSTVSADARRRHRRRNH